MFGRQFWSKFHLKFLWNYQLLNFLLLGTVVCFFIITSVSRASSLTNFSLGYVKTNYASSKQYIQKSSEIEVEKQVAFEESYQISSYPTLTGNIVAALDGYNVQVHGFGFENYGDENNYMQLTSAEMERLFGEQVCDRKVNGECILTPLGEQWMEQRNEVMSGGHCDGMAVLSLLFYLNQLKVEDFGSSSVNTLQLEGNHKLQREIAYWWATQATEPTRSARDNNELTPREVVNELIKAFKADRHSELYTIAIWKRNGKGGHAVTPFAVEDRGNGIFAILVYDNNHPNIAREMIIDTNADTWRYNASVNPNAPEKLYEGDADTKTLLLTPTSFRLQLQQCPFCEEAI